MSKTKAELVAENKVLKAGMSKTKIKLSEENKILERRVFLHMEYIDGLEDEIKRLRGVLNEAQNSSAVNQKDYHAIYARNLQLTKKYGDLARESILFEAEVKRSRNTIDALNKLILDDR